MTSRLRSWAMTAIAGALAACAAPPLQPDLQATAPKLEGFGQIDLPITTGSAKARAHFNAGMLQAYAFNEREAVRQFKAALAADPACALCAWGVAWQLGPIINRPERGDLREAQRYVDLALRLAGAQPAVTASERQWIGAMALRYGHESTAKEAAPLQAQICRSSGGGSTRHPLDRAYADRLRELLLKSPQDADLLTLWVEAEIVATPGDWYDDSTGAPQGRFAEMADRLEQLLQTRSTHTGLNHYLIHVVDHRQHAHRAVAAADRLGALAPNAPHLVHMPAHTYAHVGRYADATRVNQQAVALDETLAATLKAQGFANTGVWTYHNLHFQWFGALMEGRGELALSSARQLATMAANWRGPYGEYVRSLPVLTLLRLQRWEALASEAAASGEIGLAQALHAHAQAIAQLRRGNLAAGREQLAAVANANGRLARAHAGATGFDATVRAIGDGAVASLQAEIALAERQPDAARAYARRAAELARKADDSEPPMLGAGGDWALGDLLLRAGRAGEAEATFRGDLERWPMSGWSLAGLAQALQAQGRGGDASAVQGLLAQAWPLADAALVKASR